MSPIKTFIAIIIVSALSLYIALPQTLQVDLTPWGIQFNQTINKRAFDARHIHTALYFNPGINLGLDLQGGTHLTLQADMSSIEEADRLDALESAKEIITRRVDLFGVAEPLVQTSINPQLDQYRIIVELPGVDQVSQAVSLIGQTAQLEFREQTDSQQNPEATMSALAFIDSFQPTGLTGKDLKKAVVEFDPQGQPVVGLQFTPEGSELFSNVTERNVNKIVGIYIDGYPVTLPTVNTAITDGRAQISGDFTIETAKNLAIQLNSGALPVPIEVISQTNVGATLGRLSVQQSIIAGIVGISMVVLFMSLYYGYLGILAVLALAVYGLITIAAYKIIGVTVTLPGLAGLMLSIGMAVDSNILIFERYKEELRLGRQWKTAMELAFGRAWDSIKDANVVTLTICFILFNPFNWNLLNTSGIVRGFALTLALGIVTSLFTGIIVTRTLIRLFYQGKKAV